MKVSSNQGVWVILAGSIFYAGDFVRLYEISLIKMYTHTWDEIINHGRLELFNDSNFTKDVVMHTNPDINGIDSARAFYANYCRGRGFF